ncbi:SDR family NAD(P)-dependent oxidoreductase [Streptomyces sioyaensis]
MTQEEIPVELNLTDKIAVVTGGSKGIGLAVTEALGREGARVVVGSRTETTELAALRKQYDVAFHPVDLADADGAVTLAQEAADRHGRIDVLVNNVGATSPRSSFRRLCRNRRGQCGQHGTGGPGPGRTPADGHLHRTHHRTPGGG